MDILRSCLALFTSESEDHKRKKVELAASKIALLTEKLDARVDKLRKEIDLRKEKIQEIRKEYSGIPRSGVKAELAKKLQDEIKVKERELELEERAQKAMKDTHYQLDKMQETQRTENCLQEVATLLQELGLTDEDLQLTQSAQYAKVIGQVNTKIKDKVERVANDIQTINELDGADEFQLGEDELDDQIEQMEQDDRQPKPVKQLSGKEIRPW